MKTELLDKTSAVNIGGSKHPMVIKVHSFSGKPMKEPAFKKFVDGPIVTAHNAVRKFPVKPVVEDDSDL